MADISSTGMTQVDHHHTAHCIGVSELADCHLLFDRGDDLWFIFRADGFHPVVSTLLEIFSLTV